MNRPDLFQAYTVALLSHGQQFLLLQRARDKAFLPGLWTGIGGRVESDQSPLLPRSTAPPLPNQGHSKVPAKKVQRT